MFLFTSRYPKKFAKKSLRETYTEEQLSYARQFAEQPIEPRSEEEKKLSGSSRRERVESFIVPDKLSVIRAMKFLLHKSARPVRQRLSVARSLRTPEQLLQETARLEAIIKSAQEQIELNKQIHANSQQIILENEQALEDYRDKLEQCWIEQNRVSSRERREKKQKSEGSASSKTVKSFKKSASAEKELAARAELQQKQIKQRDRLVEKGFSLEEANDLVGLS